MTRLRFGALVLLVLATVFADSALSAGFWTPLAPLPAPQSLHGVAVVDGIIYAVGGSRVISCAPPSECFAAGTAAFDPRTGVWSSRAATTPRKNHGTAAVGGDIYVIGGDNNVSYYDSVQVYHPVSDTWESRASMPTARSQIGAAEANGIIYVLGGRSAAAPNTAGSQNEAYAPLTNTWAVRAPMPTARYHLSVASLNGLVYAIGGSLTSGEVVSTVEVYDPLSNAWSTAASLPMPITGAATVARGGRLYVTGGSTPGIGSLRTMYVYDPAANAWTAEPDMSVRRDRHGAAVVDDRIYVVGGSVTNNQGTTFDILTSVEAFVPTEGPGGAPTNLAFTVTGTMLTLTWRAPTGAAPTSYVVEAGTSPGSSNLAMFDTGGTATTLSVPSVPAGTYYIRIRARSGSTLSGPSNEITVVIGGGGPCPPAAPTGFTALATGNTVTLSWNTVAGALSFIIEAGSAPGAANLTTFDTGSSATSFTANAPNGTYYLRVRVRTACGTSAASNEVVLTVGGSGTNFTGLWQGTVVIQEPSGTTTLPIEVDFVHSGTRLTGAVRNRSVTFDLNQTGDNPPTFQGVLRNPTDRAGCQDKVGALTATSPNRLTGRFCSTASCSIPHTNDVDVTRVQ